MQQGVQDDAPLALHDPAKQEVHAAFEIAPIALLNEPAGQEVQDDEPLVLLHVPTKHELHDAALLALHVPAKQEVHVAFEIAPIALLNEPAGQEVQDDEPLALLHVPAKHELHDAAPLALHEPAKHELHAVISKPATLELYVPFRHGVIVFESLAQYEPAGHASKYVTIVTPAKTLLVSEYNDATNG